MEMKHDIVGDKFPAVSRRPVLPAHAFADMDDKRVWVGEFITLGEMAADGIIRFFAFAEVINGRVHQPVQREHFLHPGGINLGQVHPEIGVEVGDSAVGADVQFPAILRLAEFIPPVAFCCFLIHEPSLTHADRNFFKKTRYEKSLSAINLESNDRALRSNQSR